MKRTQPLVRTSSPREAKVKLPQCAAPGCRVRFVKQLEKQEVCSVECGEKLGAIRAEKERRKEAKRLEIARNLEAKNDKERRAALKRLPEVRREAQSDFNAFIRERDRQGGYGCICCGAPLEWESGVPGGKVDAGHYLGRGASPELAFDERNVNAQRKSCNRPGGTTRISFRAGMVERHGLAVVEELEGAHAPKRYRRAEYLQISETYRAKLKALKATA